MSIGDINVWIGGATKIAEINTITMTAGGATDDLTVTLTDDGGTDYDRQFTDVGTDSNTIASNVQSDLAALVTAPWNEVTWTVNTNVVTGTVKDGFAGKPIHLSTTPTGTLTAVVATSQSSSGPMDFNVAANWSENLVPATDEILKFESGAWPCRYGLDQSTGSKGTGFPMGDPRAIHFGPAYTGYVGDPINKFYLKFDETNANGDEVIINHRSTGVWLDFDTGDATEVLIKGSSAGSESVNLKGNLGNVRVIGSTNLGTINIAASTALDELHMIDCPNAAILVNAGVTGWTLTNAARGRLTTASRCTTVVVDGAEWIDVNEVDPSGNTNAAFVTFTQWSGLSRYRGTANIGDVTINGGTADWREGVPNGYNQKVRCHNETIASTVIVQGGRMRMDGGTDRFDLTTGSPALKVYGGEWNIDRPGFTFTP